MAKMKLNIFFILSLMCSFQHCWSATFCVTTPIDLFFALNNAATNGESDIIKIAEGTYSITSFSLAYNGSNDLNLEISGGWSNLSNDPCGQQLTQTPFNTIIDANSGRPVIKIFSSDQSLIKISNIQFINGLNLSANGGALQFGDTIGSTIDIEHCAFINNISSKGAALFANVNEFIFNNNLVLGNHSLISGSIEVFLATNDIGAYFTNNTIVSNTTEGTLASSLGGVTISSQNSSQVFIANNIFWDNDTYQLNLTGDGFKHLLNNNIAGTQIGVVADVFADNFSSIPIFDPGLLNYTPALGSALINAGIHPPAAPTNNFEDNWSILTEDLYGFMRIQGSKIDIGAYESSYNTGPIFMDGFED